MIVSNVYDVTFFKRLTRQTNRGVKDVASAARWLNSSLSHSSFTKGT